MKKRFEWVDAFRALMILFIVFGHAADEDLRTYVYSFHVPAFFFISGFLFSTSNENHFLSFLKRKIQTLMIPYYIFSLLSIAIFSILGQFASDRLDISIKSSDIIPNIYGMIYANGSNGLMRWNLPLWFLPCLFATIVLFYPFAIYISKSAFSKQIQFLSFIAIILLGICFLNYYVLKLDTLPFSFENTLYLMPYFILGYGFRKIYPSVNQLIKSCYTLLFGIILLLCGGILGILSNIKVEYVGKIYGNLFIFYISATLSIAGFTCICHTIPMKFLHYIGRNTLPILLMHKFPIVLLQIIFSQKFPDHRLWVAICITLIATPMSLLGGYIIQKIFPPALGLAGKHTLSQ